MLGCLQRCRVDWTWSHRRPHPSDRPLSRCNGPEVAPATTRGVTCRAPAIEAKRRGGQRTAPLSTHLQFLLEGDFGGQLGHAHVGRGGRKSAVWRGRRRLHESGHPEKGRVGVRVGYTVVGVVEPVVSVEAQLQVDPFCNRKALAEAHIPADKTWPAEGITPYGARKVGCFGQQVCRVRPTSGDPETWIYGAGASGGEVPLAEEGLQEWNSRRSTGQIVGRKAPNGPTVNEAERERGAPKHRAGKLPTAHRQVQKAVLALEGQRVNIGGRQLVARVICGRTVIRPEIVGINLDSDAGDHAKRSVEHAPI